MSARQRLALWVVGFGIVAVGAGYGAKHCGFGLAVLYGDAEEVWRGRRMLEERQAMFQAIGRRIEARRDVAREVIARRLSLLEAAARFRELNHQPPEVPSTMLQLHYPGRTEEERHCRQVIALVAVEVQNQSGPAEAVIGRLEAELRDHLHRQDLVRLTSAAERLP